MSLNTVSDSSYIHISKADEISISIKANRIIKKSTFESVVSSIYDRLSDFIYDKFGYGIDDAIDTEIDDNSYLVRFFFLNGETLKLDCDTLGYKLSIGDEFIINDEIANKLDSLDKYGVSSFDKDDSFEIYRVVWDCNEFAINYYLRVFVVDRKIDAVFDLDDENLFIDDNDMDDRYMVNGEEVLLDDSDRYRQVTD